MVSNDKGLLKPDKFKDKNGTENYFSHRYLKHHIKYIKTLVLNPSEVFKLTES